MKFHSLEIKTEHNYTNKNDTIKGSITFLSQKHDFINLRLDDEILKQMMRLVIPIFEKASKENFDFILQEFKENAD